MPSQKTRDLVADHKRGWHDDNDMSGAGCPLCQEEFNS